MRRIAEMLLQRRAKRLIHRLLPLLPKHGKILDVGSGTGHNALAISSRLPVRVVEADVIDLHVVGPGPVLFDGIQLPFRDAEFEATVVLFVLQYANDPVALLQEIRRVTNGPVYVLQSTYRGNCGYWRLRIWDFVTGRLACIVARIVGLVTAPSGSLSVRHLFTEERLQRILRDAGVRGVSVQTFATFGFGVRRDLYALEPLSSCP